MTKKLQDAIALMEKIAGECSSGTSEHSWAKCPRCLAIALIQDRDNKGMELLQAAIEELKKR